MENEKLTCGVVYRVMTRVFTS